MKINGLCDIGAGLSRYTGDENLRKAFEEFGCLTEGE